MRVCVPAGCRGSLALLLLAAVACGGGAKDPQSLPEPELTSAQKIRMAQSYLNAGRMPDALEMLDEVIADDPDNANVHNFKGQVLFFAGRYGEAQAALERALQLDPHLSDAHNNLGVVLDAQGRKSEAEQQYRLALADPAYPTPEKAYLNLGLLYSSMGREREAIDELRRAVEIDTDYYKAHYELASVLERVGENEEALREYQVAAPGYRRDGRYFYRLGLAYFRLGRKDEARESLLRVVDLAPGSPSAAQADDLLEMID
jgi:type IV pilus assembly protein PilF